MNTADRLTTGFAELARLHEVLRRSDLPDATRITASANYIGLDAASRATGEAQTVSGAGVFRI